MAHSQAEAPRDDEEEPDTQLASAKPSTPHDNILDTAADDTLASFAHRTTLEEDCLPSSPDTAPLVPSPLSEDVCPTPKCQPAAASLLVCQLPEQQAPVLGQGNAALQIEKSRPQNGQLTLRSTDEIYEGVKGQLHFAAFTDATGSKRLRGRLRDWCLGIFDRAYVHVRSWILPKELYPSSVQDALRAMTLSRYQIPVCFQVNGESIVEIALVDTGAPNIVTEDFVITLGLQDKRMDLDSSDTGSYLTPDGHEFVPSGKIILPKTMSLFNKRKQKWYRCTSALKPEVFYIGILDPGFGRLIINGEGREDDMYVVLHSRNMNKTSRRRIFGHMLAAPKIAESKYQALRYSYSWSRY